MMNATISTRALITVTINGCCVRGTYHKSQRAGFGTLPEKGRTGVLFLNPGFIPRAGDGDTAIYWADSFAKCGYPSFRVDLPGMGDSEGEIPPKLLDFINAGGYAPSVSMVVEQLVERYGLSGMVILGLCAGAITALFAAALAEDCEGVILLDPYFFLPRPRSPLRNELSVWSTSSRVGGIVGNLYDFLRQARLLLRRKQLPGNANLPLLRCWTQIASKGASILVLKAPGYKAPGMKPRTGEFDYLAYLRSRSRSATRITVQLIDGTNHSFGDLTGKQQVRRHIELWLNASFPASEFERAAAVTAAP